MKKTLVALSVLSTLSLAAMPAFAQGNITITGNGNTININQTDTINNNNMTDINGHWAEKYIKDLLKKGILSGVDKTHFNPNANVKRDEFATMVVRYFKLPKPTGTTQDFEDVPVKSWEYPYVEASKSYFDAFRSLDGGLNFHPNDGAERAHVTYTLVKILMQLNPNLQLMDATSADALLQSKFKDANDIPQALRPYVATAVQNGLIHGEGNGTFAPNRVLTRAEAAVLLDRLQDSSIVVDGSGSTTTTGTTGTDSGTGTTTTTGTDSGTGTTTTTGTDSGTGTTTTTGTDSGTGTTTTTGTDSGTGTTTTTGTDSGTGTTTTTGSGSSTTTTGIN